jgi:hypothetical protein
MKLPCQHKSRQKSNGQECFLSVTTYLQLEKLICNNTRNQKNLSYNFHASTNHNAKIQQYESRPSSSLISLDREFERP